MDSNRIIDFKAGRDFKDVSSVFSNFFSQGYLLHPAPSITFYKTAVHTIYKSKATLANAERGHWGA